MLGRSIEIKPLNIHVGTLMQYFPPKFRHTAPDKDDLGRPVTYEHIYDERDVCVFEFNKKTIEGFTRIYTAYSTKQLAALLCKLPSELSLKIKKSLEGTPLEIPNLSIEDQNKLEQKQEEQAIKDAQLKTILSTCTPLKKSAFPASEAHYVNQDKIAFTNADSSQPILCSSGACTCVIVSAFNLENKSAALAHVSGNIILTDLIEQLETLRESHDYPLLLDIVGGNQFSEKYVNELIFTLLKLPNSKIRSANICFYGNEEYGLNLSIDARSGMIANSVPQELKPSDNQMYTNILSLKIQVSGPIPKPMEVLDVSLDARPRSTNGMRRR